MLFRSLACSFAEEVAALQCRQCCTNLLHFADSWQSLDLVINHTWSLYVIGAALMIWIWTVPPLLHHRKDTFRLQLLADVLAIAVYVSLIAVDLDGWDWYWHLALPIILLLGALFLFWGLTMGRRKRSTLTSMTLVIGSIGVFILGVERFVDLFFLGHWSPGWSLIVLAVCVILIIPLIVVRRVPSLREEVRRRFHL